MSDPINGRTFTDEDLKAFVVYMKQHAYGRTNARRVCGVALALGYPWQGVGAGRYRKIRALATAAIVDLKLPICADNDGYFWAADAQDGESSLQRLKSASDSMLVRYLALKAALESA